jgi:RNA polymerase sigma-70 factor (ECF subfamily)
VALLEVHAVDVLAYLQRRTDHQDAADVLSEVLALAWRRVGDLPTDDERARMWLFATARNVLVNHHRSKRRASALSARLREQVVAQHRTAAAGTGDPVADSVRDAIDQLPAAQREVVTLVHWDGFTLTEAAEVTGVPSSTVRSRYAAARAELARRLQHHAEPPTPPAPTVPPPDRLTPQLPSPHHV